MSANDVLLLKEMVDSSRAETSVMSTSEQETYFFARHYLKTYAPSHDDLLAGVVDGTLDGGIDGIYIFVNGLCVRDDVTLRGMGLGANVQLILCQVKNTAGFGESSIEKIMTNLPILLALDRDEHKLARRFNPKLVEISRRFLRVLQELEMPELSVFVAFASLRAVEPPHPNVATKGSELEQVVKGCFGTSQPTVHFFDAANVSELARFRTPTSKALLLAENPISTDTTGGYIGVATLDEYYRFLCDASGRLDASMFDANVRDYETESGVNASIQATLEEENSDVDFWWLNNGVTVVADRVQLNGKRLSLQTPQVVNGLQTSHEIYKCGSKDGFRGSRSVLVKVVEADREETKDRIIKATNSQTTLGTSTLRATDRLQRKIEEYLLTVGLRYERRKNYYRNQQFPLEQLVSIDQLGQAVTAIFAQSPHVARGEVSRIFDDDTYQLVFHESYPLAAYARAIQLHRASEAFLRGEPSTRGEVDNFVFHLSTLAAIALTRRGQPSADDVARISSDPSPDLLRHLLDFVRQAFSEVVVSKNYALFDQVAKDPMSTSRLLMAARTNRLDLVSQIVR